MMPNPPTAGIGQEEQAVFWRAVQRRDRQAEGVFYYAVSSTGIYCRPTCPARRPKREHVVFFRTTREAERAGYRACQRCRPDQVSRQQRTLARLRQLLETSETAPTLKELAREVGMSPFHVQRLFKSQTGMSPRQYAAAVRAGRFGEALRSGSDVTQATYEAGYGSSRSVYDTAGPQLGMPPSSYRERGRGQRICYGVTESPLGRMLVAGTERGVCALRFGQEDEMLKELQAEFPGAILERDEEAVAHYAHAALAYLRDATHTLWLPLDVEATEFQRRVWEALQEIPPGERRSYGEVAAAIGRPGAARAVARACAANPVALSIPCHRVVTASGALGGFRWGRKRKAMLLERESVAAPGEPGPGGRGRD